MRRQLTDIEMVNARLRGLDAAVDPDEPVILSQVLALLAGVATIDAITAAIDALVNGAPAALDTLRELAEVLQDEQDAVAALTGLVAAKAEKTALNDLAATVAALGALAKAAGTDLRGLADDAKYLTARTVKDALSPEVADVAAPDLSRPVQTLTLSANATLGPPIHVTPGTTGLIYVKKTAAGLTLSFNAAWLPFGTVPTLSDAVNLVDAVVWTADELGHVGFWLAAGRVA